MAAELPQAIFAYCIKVCV